MSTRWPAREAEVENLAETSPNVLEPVERALEVLCGLTMVLTFTCSFSVAKAGTTEVRTMLIAAIGCCLAWEVIDAVFYLLAAQVNEGAAPGFCGGCAP